MDIAAAIHGDYVPPFKMATKSKWEQYRFLSWREKEPETIAWIESFEPNSILWDVGANIGIYTLFAASRGHRVLAFEPFLPNWITLQNNIRLNGYQDRVRAILCGIGEWNCFSTFASNQIETGSSGGQLGYHGKIEYDLPVYTLDTIKEEMSEDSPDYIKIDVDGLEPQIVSGIGSMICLKTFRSCLIELPKDGDDREDIFEAFFEKYTTNNAFNSMPNHSRNAPWRKSDDGVENIVFTRLP
jgi:FkbM family methyltransferase